MLDFDEEKKESLYLRNRKEQQDIIFKGFDVLNSALGHPRINDVPQRKDWLPGVHRFIIPQSYIEYPLINMNTIIQFSMTYVAYSGTLADYSHVPASTSPPEVIIASYVDDQNGQALIVSLVLVPVVDPATQRISNISIELRHGTTVKASRTNVGLHPMTGDYTNHLHQDLSGALVLDQVPSAPFLTVKAVVVAKGTSTLP